MFFSPRPIFRAIVEELEPLAEGKNETSTENALSSLEGYVFSHAPQ
jgi:hypothetical protein